MRFLPLCFLAAAVVCRLNATPVTWALSGQVSFIDPNLSSVFAVGNAFTGSVTFETGTAGAPHWDVPDITVYAGAVTAFSFTVGSVSGAVDISTHPMDALVKHGQVLAFASGHGDTSQIGTLPDGLVSRYVAAQFSNYGIQQLSDVLTVGDPPHSNSFFRIDFDPDSAFTGALIASGITAVGPAIQQPVAPTGSNVPDNGATALLIFFGLAALTSGRRIFA